jgi:palmitoyltransferase
VFFCLGTLSNLALRTDHKNYTTYAYGVLIFFADLFFILLINKDPGYLKAKPEKDLLKLYSNYDSYLVCPDCEVYRPARSRHCQSCDKCVEKFDHHCPWVNNCIGARNLGLFFAFINLVWLSLMSTIALNVYALVVHMESNIINMPYEVDMAFSIFFTVIAFIFAVPLTLLLTIHYKNFINNRTTNERFSKSSNESKVSAYTVSFENKHGGCWQNFMDMCCNITKHNRINEEKPSSPSVESSYYEVIERLKFLGEN